MTRLLRCCLSAALLSVALTLLWTVPSRAVNASAFISGIVTDGGHPVAHVQVTATGNNLTVKTTTDAQGRLHFRRSRSARMWSRRRLAVTKARCALT
jgi:hypothetical protein